MITTPPITDPQEFSYELNENIDELINLLVKMKYHAAAYNSCSHLDNSIGPESGSSAAEPVFSEASQERAAQMLELRILLHQGQGFGNLAIRISKGIEAAAIMEGWT